MKRSCFLLLLGFSVAFAEQPKVDLKDCIFYVYLKNRTILKVDRMAKSDNEKMLKLYLSSGTVQDVPESDIDHIKVDKRPVVPEDKSKAKEPEKSVLDLTTDQFVNLDKQIIIPNAVLTLSTYFNYGYRDNGLTHVSFEIRDKTGRGHVYVSKDWAGAEALRQMALRNGPISGDFIVQITSSHYEGTASGLMAELVGYRLPKE